MAAFYIRRTLDYPDPLFSDGIFLGNAFYDALGAGTPFIASFTLARTSSTSWRATFANPVLNIPPLNIPACYAFSPALEVRQLVPVLNGQGNATAVDIITLEQGPVTYTLTIYGLERA